MFGMAGLGFRKPTEEDKKYGNFNRRMFAATLDLAFIALLVAPVIDALFGIVPIDMQGLQSHLAMAHDEVEKGRMLREYLVQSGVLDQWLENTGKQFSILFVLVAICWHFWAATPGKMIARLKIVDEETLKPISDLQILLRLTGYIMSGLCFLMGFFWIGIDKRRQGWHDKFAGTLVVTIPWKKPIPDSTTVDP